MLATSAILGTSIHPTAADPAAPSRAALVIGNASYPGLPPLPRCETSAQAVATALRAAGFTVQEAPDAGNAEIGARLAALRSQLHPAGQGGPAGQGFAPEDTRGAAVLYVCGYARAVGDRSFLLPTDAHIEQPTDLLAQGVLLRSLGEVPAAVRAAEGLVLLDLTPAPGEGPLPGLEAVAGMAGPAAGVVIAAAPATASHANSGPTELANAAAAALSRSDFKPGAATTAIGGALGPAAAGVVIGAPTPVLETNRTPPGGTTQPAPTVSPQAAPGASAAGTPGAAQTSAAAQAPVTADASPASHAGLPSAASGQATLPAAAMPDPDTLDGRRRIQAALLRIGYYPGPVDGKFGPDTQAAIRRLQHELGDPLSGHLTPAEVLQLLARAG